MGLKPFIPNVASMGFGLFFATFATSAWGGAFPMLPTDFQTYDVLIIYFLVESLAFCAMFFVGMGLSFVKPALLRHRSSVLGSPLMVVGSLCLIAPLYYEALTIVFIVAGGALFGLGAALFFLSWQRLFASYNTEQGTLDLVIGMGLSAPIYGLMHMMPSAIAAFSVPLVLIPLSEVCLIEASRSMDFDQPMFTDDPKLHRRVYLNAVTNSSRSALYVGAFGFASGITRAIAVKDPAMGSVVNAFAMIGLLIASIALLWLWRRRSFSFDTYGLFRTVAPVAVTAFLLMPYLNETYLYVFSGVMYMFFSLSVMVMMVQCMQISRNSGISPTFIYGFFGGIVYMLQACGFLFGYSTETFVLNASPQLATFALLSTWVFMMVTQLSSGKVFAHGDDGAVPDVEFLALAQPKNSGVSEIYEGREECEKAGEASEGEGLATFGEDDSYGQGEERERAGEGERCEKTERAEGAESRGGYEEDLGIKDRISKQSRILTKRYLLTAREAQVMELLVRGNTAADIASKLTISENTAKTHVKRLYTKLDVHKRRELLNLFEELD